MPENHLLLYSLSLIHTHTHTQNEMNSLGPSGEIHIEIKEHNDECILISYNMFLPKILAHKCEQAKKAHNEIIKH